jgi:hypothetical protein
VHARIEKEFYDIETFNSLGEFLSKAWTFELYWNLERENLKLKKTPFQIVKEKCAIYDPGIVNFQPFILDELTFRYSFSITKFLFIYPRSNVPHVRRVPQHLTNLSKFIIFNQKHKNNGDGYGKEDFLP